MGARGVGRKCGGCVKRETVATSDIHFTGLFDRGHRTGVTAIVLHAKQRSALAPGLGRHGVVGVRCTVTVSQRDYRLKKWVIIKSNYIIEMGLLPYTVYI